MEKLDDESECVYQFRLNFINNFKLKNKDMKEKEPGLDPIENAEKSKKLFDQNVEKYKDLMT